MKKSFYIFNYTYCTGYSNYVIAAKTLEKAIKEFYAVFPHASKIHSIKHLGTEKEIFL